MLRLAPKRRFGLFGGLRKIWSVPKAHLDSALAPGGGNRNMLQNATLLFDDMAQEWQATFVEDTYSLNAFQASDAVLQGNFGTLDNPHLIFTNDIPFRFVGCTGPPNEDDYEGHELFFFLLREGPLQRCQSCGQVFKLVRIRDEASSENDYYNSSFFKLDYAELGDADHWVQFSPLRWMPHSYEHTHFEVQSNPVFTLRNPDQHDRVLTDPAHRLEQFKLSEDKLKVYIKALAELEGGGHVGGRAPFAYSKQVYENVVAAQLAIDELDRHFRRVQKFNMRAMVDPANHARREARMTERAEERRQGSHTVFFNDASEGELQFRDYFESDDELAENLGQRYSDKSRIMASPAMAAENYVFQEIYSTNAEPDATSYVNRKVFRFNYREAFYKPEDLARKEKRMVGRFMQAGVHKAADELNERLLLDKALPPKEKAEMQKQLHDALIEQAVENYKSFFESDLEEDFGYLEGLPVEEKRQFLTTFEKSGLPVGSPGYKLLHVSFPKETDPEGGMFQSASALWHKLEKSILPVYGNLNGMNFSEEALNKVKEKIDAELNKKE